MNENEQDPNVDAPDNPDAAAPFEAPAPAPQALPPPAREPVGALLRSAREEAGLSIRDVADSLRIQFLFIQALEESNYGKLPGAAYAVGFLRTYCQHLELDVEELVQRYKEEQAGLDRKPDLVFPTPVPESKVPGAALILVSVLLVGLAYGAWAFFSEGELAVADLVPAVPPRLQNLMAEEESGGPVSPDVGERAAAPDGGTVASLSNTSSPVFVLPQPDEESGLTSSAPVETAVVTAAPESVQPVPETVEPAVAAAPVEEPAAASVVETAAALRVPQTKAPEETAVAAPAATVAAEPVVPEPAPAASPETLIETAEPLVAPEPEFAASAPSPEAAEVVVAPEPALQTAAVPEAPASETIPSAPATEALVQGADEHLPQVYGAANANARIILRAIQDSWVQVRDSENSLLLTRLLRAGDSYRVPNRTDLTMLTGNAGGLQIEVDGNRLGTLGPVGKVRRDVTLDPVRLLKDRDLTR